MADLKEVQEILNGISRAALIAAKRAGEYPEDESVVSLKLLDEIVKDYVAEVKAESDPAI